MFNSRRILIVEDEPFVVIELVEAVERSGGAVVGPVPTVAEALALLDQHKIDAAILTSSCSTAKSRPLLSGSSSRAPRSYFRPERVSRSCSSNSISSWPSF